MNGHLDLDGLADVLAGEGADTEMSHLAGCPRCSAALVDLEAAQAPVRAALAALPTPEVPADLAARLDAALLRAHERSDVVRLPQRVVRRHRVFAVAAGAVVMLGLGGLAASLSRSADTTATTSAGSRAGPEAAAVPVVPTSSTGTDYAPPDALAGALPALLRGSGPRAVPATGDALVRLHDPAELAGCLLALAGPTSGGAPLALDYARYAGAPALVVVLPAAAAGKVDVFVVGAGCRAGADQTLLFTRLAKPS